MRELPLDSITLDTLLAMQRDGIGENRHLDYKRELPTSDEKKAHDFVADVCSFANVGGGDLVYGVAELKDDEDKNTGLIGDLVGLTNFNPDGTIQWIESIIRDGLDPRIPQLRFKVIERAEAPPLFIVRVPRSFAGPHLVKRGGTGAPTRFYARATPGSFSSMWGRFGRRLWSRSKASRALAISGLIGSRRHSPTQRLRCSSDGRDGPST